MLQETETHTICSSWKTIDIHMPFEMFEYIFAATSLAFILNFVVRI